MLLKTSWFGVYCAACVMIVTPVLGYDRWAEWSIRTQFIAGADIISADKAKSWADLTTVNFPNFALRDVSVATGNCSLNYWWGSVIYYREDDAVIPQNHFVHVGRACRDWANGRWILMPDVPGSWDRYWR